MKPSAEERSEDKQYKVSEGERLRAFTRRLFTGGSPLGAFALSLWYDQVGVTARERQRVFTRCLVLVDRR